MPAARRTTLLSVAGLAGLGIAVALIADAGHKGPWPYIGRGGGAAAIIFGICGLAAAARLTPAPLRSVWPVLALPAGATAGSLALTVLGFAAVPLAVSLWVVLALGVAAWWRFGRGHAPRPDWWGLAPWLVAAVVAFGTGTLPAWHYNETTIFGKNPDSHQVVGSAVLLQNAPAWAAREGMPVNVVPSVWQSRYPILYALAGASNLSHFDPIFVFPGFVGVLLAMAALGFAALVVVGFRLPPWTGPPLAMVLPLNALVLHMAWHPYYNQMWGMALLPWALLFGWHAAREASRTAAIGFAGLMVMLGLAYPLAALYPAVTTAGFAWAYGRRRPRIPRPRGVLQSTAALAAGLLLIVPVLAGLDKIWRGLAQLVDLDANLWGGDIFAFVALDEFVGTDGGVLAMLTVLALAGVAVARRLTRREAGALAALVVLCAIFDVRLRLSTRGQYMDFKHLGYLGAVVLAFAAAGLVVAMLSRRRLLAAGAAVLAAAWTVIAVGNVRDRLASTPEQVTADMLLLREWAAQLPDDASIRIDLPPSGNQLWAQYMLAEQPLGTPFPLLNTTYARMPFSSAGDYVLHPRFLPGQQVQRWPAPRFSAPEPAFESHSFILRRLDDPEAEFSDRTSRVMIQPGAPGR